MCLVLHVWVQRRTSSYPHGLGTDPAVLCLYELAKELAKGLYELAKSLHELAKGLY